MKKTKKHPLRENYERYFGGLGTGFQNSRKNETTRKRVDENYFIDGDGWDEEKLEDVGLME